MIVLFSMTPLEQIESEVLKLSEEEQRELAYQILDRVSGGFETPEIEKAWIEEIERRVEEINKGTMEMIPMEEVMKQAREILKK
jgi:putative addiction module component (TIGR02574 family)